MDSLFLFIYIIIQMNACFDSGKNELIAPTVISLPILSVLINIDKSQLVLIFPGTGPRTI
jgi:hypothetical protein